MGSYICRVGCEVRWSGVEWRLIYVKFFVVVFGEVVSVLLYI